MAELGKKETMDQDKQPPELVLGTMTFGEQVDERAADRIIELFLAAGYREIDTAFDYCKGAAEKILGRILTPDRREKLYLATKANPWVEGGAAAGKYPQTVGNLPAPVADRIGRFVLPSCP